MVLNWPTKKSRPKRWWLKSLTITNLNFSSMKVKIDAFLFSITTKEKPIQSHRNHRTLIDANQPYTQKILTSKAFPMLLCLNHLSLSNRHKLFILSSDKHVVPNYFVWFSHGENSYTLRRVWVLHLHFRV